MSFQSVNVGEVHVAPAGSVTEIPHALGGPVPVSTTPDGTQREHEVRGVRIGDVYRDQSGALWEVIALCEEPQATVRKVGDLLGLKESHVIGCRNWEAKWKAGPLR